MRAMPLRAVSSLAVAALVVAVAGCGGSQADREEAPPATLAPATTTPTPVATATAAAETPAPQPTPTAAATPPATATPTPSPPPSPTEVATTPEPAAAERTPKPERSADTLRGPETGQPESRSGKPEKTPAATAGATKDSKESGATGASAGQEYTWQDGDRVERITLESGLVVQPSSQNTANDIVARNDGESSIVQRQARHATSDTQPVFRSSGGQLMTLPGGVLLVLDDAWDQARVNRFFSENGISTSAVERQDWAINGFFIQTKPGMPSLNLANQLAVLEGVEISSPNWQTEVSLR